MSKHATCGTSGALVPDGVDRSKGRREVQRCEGNDAAELGAHVVVEERRGAESRTTVHDAVTDRIRRAVTRELREHLSGGRTDLVRRVEVCDAGLGDPALSPVVDAVPRALDGRRAAVEAHDVEAVGGLRRHDPDQRQSRTSGMSSRWSTT